MTPPDSSVAGRIRFDYFSPTVRGLQLLWSGSPNEVSKQSVSACTQRQWQPAWCEPHQQSHCGVQPWSLDRRPLWLERKEEEHCREALWTRTE